jgi:O-antigen/teichoic acid export membrane protein
MVATDASDAAEPPAISRRRATIATLAGSGANTVVVSVQVLVLMPLYLHAVGPHLYGAWLGAGDFLVWMQAFDLGLPNLMVQRIGVAHGQGNTKAIAEYYATGLAVAGMVSFILAIVATFLSQFVPGWMGVTGADARLLQDCFILGVVAGSINLFNNTIVGLSRAIQDTVFLNVVVLAATILGFAVSLAAILTGWGLWAVPMGLATRAVVSIAGSALFNVKVMRGEMLTHFHVRRTVLREFLAVSPATALGGLGYALMNQSESAIVAIVLRPELAAVLVFTRKLLEVGRNVVDMIAFAAYGGVAHLIASKQRHRILQVLAEVSTLRLTCAVVGAAAYMAVNASLVAVWAGPAQYGGPALTILMGLQFLVVGQSFLLNYLYRATGPVMKGSLALLAESVVRVPLMAGLVMLLGLPGIPLAGIITGSFFAGLTLRWTKDEVRAFADPVLRSPLRVWWARGGMLAAGAVLGVLVQRRSWAYVGVTGVLVASATGAILLWIDPVLRNTIEPLRIQVTQRLRRAA